MKTDLRFNLHKINVIIKVAVYLCKVTVLMMMTKYVKLSISDYNCSDHTMSIDLFLLKIIYIL